jgi:hypothetical protein
LLIAPSIESQSQSRPLTRSYSKRPTFHRFKNTPAAVHSWNRRCAELEEQIPVALSAFHWQPVRSTKKMASMAARSGTRGRWQLRG